MQLHFILVSGLNGMLTRFVVMLLALLLLAVLMKQFNQPYFVAYIIAGVLLGPGLLNLFPHAETIAAVGEFGLIIQMFFIGANMELQSFARQARKPFTGVIAQLVFSFLFTSCVGLLYAWSFKEIVLFSFIISLSSSAIILDYLEKNRQLNQPLGILTSGILVLQDFLLVPMLLLINFMGARKISPYIVIAMLMALVIITLLLKQVFLKRKIRVPLPVILQQDHELQVFTGLLACFGFAWLTAVINLSPSVGALLAGILVAQSGSMQWLERHLIPFRVFFLSLFFFSIGLQLNLSFLFPHAALILLMVAVILVINSVLNALIFRLLKESWRSSIYAGALLSQIGEFSLVLCIVARNQQLVTEFWYQLTLSVVAVTMVFTSLWINIIRKFLYHDSYAEVEA